MRRVTSHAVAYVAGAAKRAREVGWAVWAERLAAPPILGATLSLTQAPASLWPLLFLVAPLTAALHRRASSPRAAALLGWLLGVGYFLPGLLWIGEAFLVEAERFAWMRPFAVTLLPMGLALFWAAAFAAARWAFPRREGASAAGLALALASAWSLAEVARSYLLTGFPWGLFAFSWIDAPTAQAAAWIGPYGLNTLTILAAIGPYWLILARAGGPARRPALVLTAAALAPLLTLSLLGALRLSGAETSSSDVIVRLVQPNVPQRDKWRPELAQGHLRSLLGLSAAPAGDFGPPDIVLWPETATPYSIATDPELRAAVMDRLPNGARLVYGALRFAPRIGEEPSVYNSLIALSPDAEIEAVYDKHHLVPFGEYLPFQSWLEASGIFQLAGGRGAFSSGPGPKRVALSGLPRFQPLICYEAIFPQERLSVAERPEWLLQSTNDAWFGDSSGPRQHLVQARFRAIEQGLPLFRAANTGISAGIDPYGRIMAGLDLDQRGAIDLPLPSPLELTLYVWLGETPLVGMLMIMLAGIVVMRLHIHTNASVK